MTSFDKKQPQIVMLIWQIGFKRRKGIIYYPVSPLIAREYLKCKTAQARKDLEKSHGIRYSVLIELPYFDPSRVTVIDPMHNLLSKYIMQMWRLLDSKNFEEIQALVNSFVAPSDVGRIPLKIASGFSDFTADQIIRFFTKLLYWKAF